MEWLGWFHIRGVPAAIIKLGDKYTVFRKGKVRRKTPDGYAMVDCIETKVSGEVAVIASCNDYEGGF